MTSITWLGHSGFLIECDGRKVAIDAWMRGPTFPGTDLSDVGLVLVSHGHFDHAEDAPVICNASGARLLCMHEVSFWAQAQGVPEDKVVGMNIGGTYEWNGWRFTMVQAIHSGGCPGNENNIVPGGASAGWIIRCPDGEIIYHAGDTAPFGDMELIAEMYQPRIAMLPIGGHFTMGPRGAAKAVDLLGAEHVVPMHYGTFPLLKGTPGQLREHVDPDVTVHELKPGQKLDLAPLQVAA